MPTKTYFNLPKDKREAVDTAALKEFTEHSLHKARISNIIKNAKIPRGSFYQYFKDLDDLYFHIVDEYLQKMHQGAIAFLDNASDLFEYSEETFKYDYSAFTDGVREQFMKNVLESLSNNTTYLKKFKKQRRDYVRVIYDKFCNTEPMISFDEFDKLYMMIQSMKHHIIRKNMAENTNLEDALEDFLWHLKIIKYGVMKR